MTDRSLHRARIGAIAVSGLVLLALALGALVSWPTATVLAQDFQNATHPVGFAIATVTLVLAVLHGTEPRERASREGPGRGGPERKGSGRTGSAAGAAGGTPLRRALLVALLVGVILLAFGAVLEVAQSFVGRTASLQDLLADLAGIVAGACAALGVVAVTRERRAGLGVPLLLCGVLVLGASLARYAPLALSLLTRPGLPVLEDFSGWLPLRRVASSPETRLRVLRPDESIGHPTLEMTLGEDPWPSMRLIDVRRDWHRYAALRVTLRNPGPEPLELVLRVHDRLHDDEVEDRFRRHLEVPPSASRADVTSFEFPMRAIRSMGRAHPAREMLLDAISGVVLFGRRESAGRKVEIIELRLLDAPIVERAQSFSGGSSLRAISSDSLESP